ncbi:MAG: hypothetical protein AB8B55_12715 [Mariniblastus sp.]
MFLVQENAMGFQAIKFCFILVLLTAFALTINPSVSHASPFQEGDPFDDPFGDGEVIDAVKKPKKDDKKKAEEEPEEKAEKIAEEEPAPKEEVNPQYAQLHLRDGSIIGGDIQTKTISVKTSYGTLVVPVGRIVRMYPGLKSNPELNQQIAELVEELGGKESAKRDAAQKGLLKMGVKIRNLLRQAKDGGNAERKKRMVQILTELDEMAEEAEEEAIALEPQMISEDRVVTPDFAIVGEILEKEFKVVSKFGDLRVQLSDIKLADRKIKETKQTIRKTVSVGAMAFFQSTPVKTSIRVNKGDRVVIKADGIVEWTNFSQSSTPAGLSGKGQWNGINGGKLTARIGTNNSKVVQVGASGDFIAKTSGVLYLGIAMQDSYATGRRGYTWTGSYKAKIAVTPAED